MDEENLKLMVEKLLKDLLGENIADVDSAEKVTSNKEVLEDMAISDDKYIPDITEINIKEQLLVPNPNDKEGYLKMKEKTPARIGVWRAGPRNKTETLLRVRADHAAAQDSVFSYVSEEFIKENNLVQVNTMCKSKDEYITRPDLGRKFSEETTKFIKERFSKGYKVQIMVGDGLSSAAIEANIKDVIPAINQGLKMYGIDSGEVLFVKYCRVASMDVVGEATGVEVVCLLVGERPGLVTAESMSAYIAYKPRVNMPEARRTVISNIQKGGTTAVEAGAHIAELIKLMLEKKVSGVDLKI